MKYLSATTEFSLGQSLLSVTDIVGGDDSPGLVKEYGIDKAFICDTMNVSAMIPLSSKLGDKLAFGVRFNLVETLLDEKKLPVFQPKAYPLSEKAMQVLYKYLSMSFEKPQFYYTARLSLSQFGDMLAECPGEFAVTTGDFFSLLKHPKAEALCKVFAGYSKFYTEMIAVHNAVFQRVNKIANELPYEKISLRPSLYLKGDEEAFPIHYSINKNVEFNFLNPYNTDLYYKDDGFVLNGFDKLPFYVWKAQDAKLPKLALDPDLTLKQEVLKGFKERFSKEVYGHKPTPEELKADYIPRLQYELDTIGRLGFASYFLMVWELTSWCQRQGIFTGPGRGSAAGSLISYCLKITDVDPIKAGLMFERFINPSRLDLPDIDLDFMSTRRDEIIEHLYDRYGRENVAGIINYASLQSKSALRSTCRILGLPATEYDCSKLIPSEFGFTSSLEVAKAKVVDIKQFADKYPLVWNVATKLETKMRNFGTHAAGIIVSNRPLINDAVIEQRGGSRVINWDKKICEKQGLIKLDVLGLTTLDILDLCVRYINDRHGIAIDMRSIKLDDKRVLEGFAKGQTGGVFQFEGGSVKRLLRDLSQTVDLTFEDLVAANALNRPGPIEAGLVGQYVKGKNGDPVEAWHPLISHIVEPTYNIPAYQEQIMQISVDLAGYTLPEADNLRKIMGKKDPVAMTKEEGKFTAGCISMGVSSEVAKEVFDKIKGFAMYAFNKSHSYAYSMLGYICMYLKVYYPVEFYAASLTFIGEEKVRPVINEAKKLGIDVLPPDIRVSTNRFTVADKYTIVAPLNKVKYLSDAAANDIMRARSDAPFDDYDDFVDRTTKRFVNARVLRGLDAIGSLDGLLGRVEADIDPVERSRAINEYLPSIPLGFVAINRKLTMEEEDKSNLNKLFNTIKAANPDTTMPFVGKTPRLMIVFDNASATEEKEGQFTISKAFKTLELALMRNGLSKADVYFTGVVKRGKKKGEKLFSNETLENAYADLRKEIDIIRPPVIVALGTNAARFFNPAMKGSALDNSGTVIYDKSMDTNVVLGFAPSQIFFNPELEEKLNELIELVSEMI
jgi:DNA polymerase-3 subunit alpha